MNMQRFSMRSARLAAGAVLSVSTFTASAQVATVPTMDPGALAEGLNPVGLTITSVSIRGGVEGQFGTFTNFVLPPVTSRHGIVLSSGNVAQMGPFPEASQPGYDPSNPPSVINSAMNPNPDGGALPEFNAYGSLNNNIENFSSGFDVAALEVHFVLNSPSPVKFDFIFGSVEYPYWTSQYTDAFLVFLDGTDPTNQVTFDANGKPVQVGLSFAGLETIDDLNTAFSNPHGLIHHLTTTTVELDEGEHVIIFEVADVNDQVLDSAAFIANLRAEAGSPGTDPSDDDPTDCIGDTNGDGYVNTFDLGRLLSHFGQSVTPRTDGDTNGDGTVNTIDLGRLLSHFGDHC